MNATENNLMPDQPPGYRPFWSHWSRRSGTNGTKPWLLARTFSTNSWKLTLGGWDILVIYDMHISTVTWRGHSIGLLNSVDEGSQSISSSCSMFIINGSISMGESSPEWAPNLACILSSILTMVGSQSIRVAFVLSIRFGWLEQVSGVWRDGNSCSAKMKCIQQQSARVMCIMLGIRWVWQRVL